MKNYNATDAPRGTVVLDENDLLVLLACLDIATITDQPETQLALQVKLGELLQEMDIDLYGSAILFGAIPGHLHLAKRLAEMRAAKEAENAAQL